MSSAQKKQIGGRIIITGTLLLLVPLAGVFFSFDSLWMHVLFQVIWGVSMIVGGMIAFESEKTHQRRR